MTIIQALTLPPTTPPPIDLRWFACFNPRQPPTAPFLFDLLFYLYLFSLSLHGFFSDFIFVGFILRGSHGFFAGRKRGRRKKKIVRDRNEEIENSCFLFHS
ncbi:hypothetical protein HanPSC8_Chr15g0656351 [Helianthus annuus]|nr:hypothetical protein HanPSC8_Chr15g0656351 [Helianthus annuus]